MAKKAKGSEKPNNNRNKEAFGTTDTNEALEYDPEVEEEETEGEDTDLKEAAAAIQQLLEKVYSKQTHKNASKESSAKLYDNGIKVSRRRGMADEDKALTREERIKEEYKYLAAASQKYNRIVKLHIEGVEQDRTYGFVLRCRLPQKEFGEFKIYIAANELYDFNLADFKEGNGKLSGEELFLRDLEKFVGVDVDTVIYDADEKKRTAFAAQMRAKGWTHEGDDKIINMLFDLPNNRLSPNDPKTFRGTTCLSANGNGVT